MESSNQPDKAGIAWYCLRTQQKREHIAAKLLKSQSNIEVYCPRISQIKKTRAGKRRYLEALFPNYIFARFEYEERYREVIYTSGISYLVDNGRKDPVVVDAVIEELKKSVPNELIEAPDPSLEPGVEIEVIGGSLKGLNGKVLAVLPAKRRVEILLSLLGQELQVELPEELIFKK